MKLQILKKLKRKPIQVELEEPTKKELKKRAKKLGVSYKHIVELLIKAWLKEQA